MAHDLTRGELLRYGAIGAGMLLGGIGCGGDDSSKPAAAAAEALTKPKKKPSRLVIRTWGDPWKSHFQSAAGKTFTAETGIPIEWDVTDQMAMQTKIRTAVKADQRPPVDADMNIATNGFLSYVQKVSRPIDPKVATGLSGVNEAVAKAGAGLPGYAFLGMYSYGLPLTIRTDKVKPEQLRSIGDLYKPEFENRIALTPSFHALTLPIAKLLGVDPATDDMEPVWKKLRELKPNLFGLLDETEKVNGLISGDIWISQGLAGNGLAAQREGAPIGFVVPSEGMVIDRDVYYVPRNTPPESAYYANVFVNHLVEAANQSRMAKDLGVTPVAAKTKLPGYMRKDPNVYPFTEEQMAGDILMPVELAARHLDDWQSRYDQALK